MNEFLKTMKQATNYTYTENGAITHVSTLNKVLDLFAMGGAMRDRTEEDIISLFSDAYYEHATLAVRCLFYLRDILQGQGERRFFRVCYNWLANTYPDVAIQLIPLVSSYGRYDDLFVLFDTKAEEAMLKYIAEAIQENKDALLFKWMPSLNTSSAKTRTLAKRFQTYLNMSERQYRKMLSEGRKACHLVETMMSQNHWDEIDFSKLPSRAGLLYKNAFMNREETAERYAAFMSNKAAKVNAKALYPVDIAHQIFRYVDKFTRPTEIERAAWQRYWDSLPDFYNGKEEPGIAIVDVSGSMAGLPMEAAISIGAYIAERGKGPFHNHFITFSDNPTLVEFIGRDIFDKIEGAYSTDWGFSTNIEATLDLILNTARENKLAAKDMPQTLYILSDMEFNAMVNCDRYHADEKVKTLIEQKMSEWQEYGYKVPRIIFWNLRSAQRNIPAIGETYSYISGYSPVMIEQVLGGKNGWELCLDKLNSPRYNKINVE